MGLLAKHVQHKREVMYLREAIKDSRSTLHTIEYGAANLRLLGLNPAVWEDNDCAPFLKHELAISILAHWRDKDAIDNAAGRVGYALEFAADALPFLECKSADDFVALSKSKLSMYPDDELMQYVYELSDADLASLNEFIRSATISDPHDGG